MSILARSIGLRAADILCAGAAGRVLASFERVCDLVTDDGAVAALVWDGIGNGPLNVVLEHGPGLILPTGTRFAVRDAVLRFDGPADHEDDPLQAELAAAALWNPRPDWEALRTRREQIAENAYPSLRKPGRGRLDDSSMRAARSGLRSGKLRRSRRHPGPRGPRTRADSGRRRLAGRVAAGAASGVTRDGSPGPVRPHQWEHCRPHDHPQPCLSGLRRRGRSRFGMARIAERSGKRIDEPASQRSSDCYPDARRDVRRGHAHGVYRRDFYLTGRGYRGRNPQADLDRFIHLAHDRRIQLTNIAFQATLVYSPDLV